MLEMLTSDFDVLEDLEEVETFGDIFSSLEDIRLRRFGEGDFASVSSSLLVIESFFLTGDSDACLDRSLLERETLFRFLLPEDSLDSPLSDALLLFPDSEVGERR